AVTQRLADDLNPALGVELDQNARDVSLHRAPGQEHAAGDLRRRVAPGDQGGNLDLGRRERGPAGIGPRPARTADAAPDAVAAKPAVGAADVPARIHALVQGDGLVQRGPGLFVL